MLIFPSIWYMVGLTQIIFTFSVGFSLFQKASYNRKNQYVYSEYYLVERESFNIIMTSTTNGRGDLANQTSRFSTIFRHTSMSSIYTLRIVRVHMHLSIQTRLWVRSIIWSFERILSESIHSRKWLRWMISILVKLDGVWFLQLADERSRNNLTEVASTLSYSSFLALSRIVEYSGAHAYVLVSCDLVCLPGTACSYGAASQPTSRAWGWLAA